MNPMQPPNTGVGGKDFGSRDSNHYCHARNCKTRCKPEFLMCPHHWWMVPARTQALVYRYYKPGQCDLDPVPSGEWHAAADMAIAQVARKEGFITAETLYRIIAKAKTVLKDR